MISNYFKFILCFGFLFVSYFSHSQQGKIDSLHSLVKTDKTDTSKVKHLNALAWEISYRNPDTAMIVTKEALHLAKMRIVFTVKAFINFYQPQLIQNYMYQMNYSH